jgi:G3E family GTPase
MRIIVLSGFLGSGKTSLLLQLAPFLSQHELDGRTNKVAVIENEIGAVGVDGAALAGSGLEVREMLSGCVCCSLQDNLAFSIAELKGLYDPDYLVIETTGLASGSQVEQGIRASVDNVGEIVTIAIVDTSRFMDLLGRTGMMVKRQLEDIDMVILNKTDLVTGDEIEKVRAEVTDTSPDATIIEMSASGRVPEEALLSIVGGFSRGESYA